MVIKMSEYSQNTNTYQKTSFWSLHGRMRRTTYALLSVPTIFILMILRIGMEGAVSDIQDYDVATLFFMTIIELIPFYFLVFIGIKRLHDCDYKGWWILVPFVIVAIWFVRPTQGENRFGFDPRDNDYYDEVEFEKDYSWFGVITIALLYNFALISQAVDMQNNKDLQNDASIHQSSQSVNISTNNTTPNHISASNLNESTYQSQITPQAVLPKAKSDYDNAVANINLVWNSLHPSVQDFLRDEQRAINKKREVDCTAYGNTQSSDKNIAKAHRYLCEVPQLNERAEYLKTQLNTTVTPPEPTIEPQDLPQTGATNKPNLYGNSPLQIKTNAGSHYWVKIVNSYNEKDELVSYFIRGGETLDVNLPMGSYVVKYAYGDTWYGREHLFGENTAYSKADEVLEFYHGQGYVIELVQQLNGNLHTKQIDESEF